MVGDVLCPPHPKKVTRLENVFKEQRGFGKEDTEKVNNSPVGMSGLYVSVERI
jgi:hypothetical protein